MPKHTEPQANGELRRLLDRMLPTYKITAENTQQIVGKPGLQPDILITATGRAPVVIEAEFMPAYTAEPEAKDRLGLEVAGAAALIDAAIALRYPDGVSDADDLAQSIRDARLSYCVLYEDNTRFPESGWLEGSVEDLSDLVRLVSVSQSAVDAVADALEQGIDRAASILEQLAESKPDVIARIAGLLGMSEVLQTYRMAGAIVANAMVFHERIAGLHGVKTLSQVCSTAVASPKRGIVDAWTEILKINYWPIFAIARDVVEQLPSAEAAQILTNLRITAEDVEASGANQAHDLTGRIFQRLIADRKYLATFYTLPSSAALLARLAVSKMDVDWSDAEAIANLRIGDFACGTGALLAAVYDRIATLHERAGGDLTALHPTMMEEVLYGCDVMPSAIHITGSTLSGAQPTVGFGKTRLYTLAYGRQDDGDVRIGSLELLQSSSSMTLFNTSDPAMRTGSVGEETAAQVIADVPDGEFDLVIMNPPFTRAGSDWEGSERSEDYIKQFRGLSTDLETQKEMSRAEKEYSKGTCAHGYAGIASTFAALGHRKLKPGGVLALVLPLTVAVGQSWQKFRQMMGDSYANLSVLSVAANGSDMSFSSDTGMAECLVIARKREADELPDREIEYISLSRRPSGFAYSATLANSIVDRDGDRRLEDGPYGGFRLTVGEELIGEMLLAQSDSDSESWSGVRLLDFSLGQAASQLVQSKLWLPGLASALDLQIAQLNQVGNRGMYHMNISGKSRSAPFDKIAPNPTATYPSLWNHNAKNETRIVCEPDSQLQARQGMETRAAQVWATASRTHLNLDYTFGSQPLAVAFTEQKSIGGRVWPNVSFDDDRFDYAFAVWGNSTLGLLSYWWHSSRQQSSKASITIRKAETLPILDLRALTDAQLTTAQSIFDDFRERELMPAYLADADPNRAYLDRRVICDLLGFDEDTYRAVRLLAAKWCAEPSVHGGKRRPKGVGLVI